MAVTSQKEKFLLIFLERTIEIRFVVLGPKLREVWKIVQMG